MAYKAGVLTETGGGGGQKSAISTLWTIFTLSSKASQCEDRVVGGQEIDANDARRWRCRGGGSEIGDFDAFDEFYAFFKSVSVRGPGGRG